MTRDGYVARWRGREYQASPDGADVRLYQPEPGEGFTEVRPGRHVRVVPVAEVEDLVYVRTTCTWQGQPFIVLAEHDGWLRVEYTGGRWPVAQKMGLEAFDFGVYQGWAPANEVTDLREQRV
ncbi:hypothetical protein ACFFMM_07445 [Micromonospora chaiyaphumensis]|uniref:Uncharacterized protein n=1 Tax=Micromonospora chaiyaphumensis TaxID=307119 RepID=A0A1C4VQR6_9ACTN|nr:hypothetical protein [Micromonospora chaiyaphumensis]SCE86327.1 hypothetical protein GA0070214_102640 [Micromonospora chaiyaphumensis]